MTRIIAHRGARSLAPENTLAAFRKAREVGADMVELDVRLCADHVPVVIHDETLKRTTDKASPVSALSLKALRKLDAGAWFVREDPFGALASGQLSAKEAGAFKGEKIPTLVEALRLARKIRIEVNIEIKEKEPHPVAARVIEAVLETDMKDRVLISSFERDCLLAVKELAPSLPRALLLTELPCGGLDPEDRIEPFAYNLLADACPPGPVSAWLPAKTRLNLWTVNEEAEMKRFIEAGVDGICTDYPQRLVPMVRPFSP